MVLFTSEILSMVSVNLLDSPVHKHGFNPPREQEASRGNCLSPPCEQEASGDQFSPPREQEANANHLSPPQPNIAEEHSVQPKTNDGMGEVLQYLLSCWAFCMLS